MQNKKLFGIFVFALMFAYVEAAVVVYLRGMYGIRDLIRDRSPFDPTIAGIELGREAATLIMLLAVGWAVGRTWQGRIGYGLITFGLWDLGYYLWLKILINWPDSFLTWDVLLLIPLPWWGPVISPMLIACLAVFSGAFMVTCEERSLEIRLFLLEWVGLGLGLLTALYVFMSDALAALPASPQQLSELRPTPFKWPIFLLGLGLMAVPLARSFWRARRRSPL